MQKLLVLLSLLSATAYAGSTWYPGGGGGGGGTVTAVTGTPPIASSGGVTPAISISQSGLSTNGYLSSGDWKTFNGGGATPANATTNGYLSSGDWVTFNGKEPAFTTLGVANGGTGTGTAFTAGSAIYAGASGIYSQDNANYFWDGTNHRLGLGSVAPAYQLTVDGGGGDAATGKAAINIVNSSGTFGPEIRLNSSASGHSYILISGSGSDAAGSGKFAIQDGGSVRLTIDGSGNIGIGSTSPAAKLDVVGTTKLGTAGVAFTAAGGCTISSTTISTTVSDLTCTGVPASAAVAVMCTGQAAFSTATANGLYCRATGTVSQVECNTILANTQAMAYSCSWVQP